MPDVLTPPLALAALVLCMAGMAKLRSPSAAADAVATLAVTPPAWVVRGFALLELGVGAWCLARPSTAAAATVGFLYGAFALLALLLSRRGSPCGCFGERRRPASGMQSALSAALSAAAVVAAVRGAHGIGWLAGRPVPQAAALVFGLGGAVYATVMAYTELPLAWSAWDPR